MGPPAAHPAFVAQPPAAAAAAPIHARFRNSLLLCAMTRSFRLHSLSNENTDMILPENAQSVHLQN